LPKNNRANKHRNYANYPASSSHNGQEREKYANKSPIITNALRKIKLHFGKNSLFLGFGIQMGNSMLNFKTNLF
jgi:hypothetical protein